MPDDIAIAVGEHFFNYRAAAVIRRQGRVLVNRLLDEDFWFLPGGRVQDGESTLEAVKREVREELGSSCNVLRPVFLVESFFSHHSRRFHELCVYYEVEIPQDAVRALGGFTSVDSRTEFQWIDELRLADIDLWPRFLISRLGVLPLTLEHIVLNE